MFLGPSILLDPSVSVCDYRYFGEVLNDGDSFPKYDEMYNILHKIFGRGLVTAKGEDHNKQRKLIGPVFHFAPLKLAIPSIEKSAHDFLDKDLVENGFLITQESFKFFSLSVIMDLAFYHSFDKEQMRQAWGEIAKLIRSQFLATQLFGALADYLPTPYNLKILALRRTIGRTLARRAARLRSSGVTRAAALRAAGESDAPRSDGGASPGADQGSGLSIELGLGLADQLLLAGCPPSRIIDECTTFLFAGHDTSSNLLAWAVYELACHPADQLRARAELARVCGPGPVRALPQAAAAALEYVPAVLRETLRLWPPAPQVGLRARSGLTASLPSHGS